MSIGVAPSIVRTFARSRVRPVPAVARNYRTIALSVMVGLALLRIVYLATWCRFDLSPDEAHYWEWSRKLDWSYYSKGPLVAWIIRLSCELFGGISDSLVGSPMLAIRIPAIVFGSLTLGSIYVLTARVFRSEGWGLLVLLMATTWPLLNVGSLLMTIDAPFICCWGWTLIAAHSAVFDRSRWGWPIAGVLIALGFMAKYTMVLWIPSFALFLMFTPRYRPLMWSRGFWTMCILASCGALPVIFWNIRHGWITLLHAGSHAGADQPLTQFHWMGPLAYVGGSVRNPARHVVLLLGVRRLETSAHGRGGGRSLRFLWFLSVPTFLFAAFSQKNGGSGAIGRLRHISRAWCSPHGG
ncbi:MAG: glycosyltransferase family 39 protein [Gemmataceae bacterium]